MSNWINARSSCPKDGEEVDLFTLSGKRLAQFTCTNHPGLITVFFTRPGFPTAISICEISHYMYPPNPPEDA